MCIISTSYLHHVMPPYQLVKSKNLDALHISVLDPKPGKISGVAQLAQECELCLFYLSSVYIYHTNIIVYSYKCIQIYVYIYTYTIYKYLYIYMSLHICGETIQLQLGAWQRFTKQQRK